MAAAVCYSPLSHHTLQSDSRIMARKKSAAQKAREEDEKRRIEADNAKKFGVHTDSQKNDSQTLPIRPPVQSSSPAPAKSRHQQHSAREHTLPLHVLHDPERRQLDLPTHKQSWDDRTDNDHNEQGKQACSF